MRLPKLGLALALISACRAELSEYFDESLTITPLRDGKVASTFVFTTLLEGATPREPTTLHLDDVSQHYTLFPLGLGQILRQYAVSELHLTLNAGKWNYDRWGYPKERDVGTGAELWAWMGDGAVTSVDERWKDLRNALAGLFCSSLGRLDELRTTSPTGTFAPEGSLPRSAAQQLRHASLPSENVCTENLTPFLKLLPCKGLSGIAQLLNPHRLFDANWHGLGVHVLYHEGKGVEVRLTFQTVSDPLRSPGVKKQDWSLNSLFARKVERACPIARSSQIRVTLPQNEQYSISPEPAAVEDGTAIYNVGGRAAELQFPLPAGAKGLLLDATTTFGACTVISQAIKRPLPAVEPSQRVQCGIWKSAASDKPLDVAMTWPNHFDHLAAAKDIASSTPLSVQRTLKEASQLNGQMSISLTNHGETETSVLYLETMPWIVQFYLHTLVPRINGVPHPGAVSNISYTAAVPHSRPTTFQAVLTVPANSTLLITMDVTKAFLRYTEHPPDAQRGWDLPPAIIVPLTDDGAAGWGDRMYTPTLLVDLATPDFSMPYNVIIFTCSLMAFIFGSTFNLLTRKFVVVSLDTK